MGPRFPCGEGCLGFYRIPFFILRKKRSNIRHFFLHCCFMSRRERNWRFYGKRHLFRRMPGKRRSSRKPAEVSAVGILRKHSLSLEVSVVGNFFSFHFFSFPQVDRSDEAIVVFYFIVGSNRWIRDTYLLNERRTLQIEWHTSGWIYVSSMWYGRVYIRTTIISFFLFTFFYRLHSLGGSVE